MTCQEIFKELYTEYRALLRWLKANEKKRVDYNNTIYSMRYQMNQISLYIGDSVARELMVEVIREDGSISKQNQNAQIGRIKRVKR